MMIMRLISQKERRASNWGVGVWRGAALGFLVSFVASVLRLLAVKIFVFDLLMANNGDGRLRDAVAGLVREANALIEQSVYFTFIDVSSRKSEIYSFRGRKVCVNSPLAPSPLAPASLFSLLPSLSLLTYSVLINNNFCSFFSLWGPRGRVSGAHQAPHWTLGHFSSGMSKSPQVLLNVLIYCYISIRDGNYTTEGSVEGYSSGYENGHTEPRYDRNPYKRPRDY